MNSSNLGMVLITGATGGIASSTAKCLAAQGYSLFLQSRNQAKLAELCREIKAEYPVLLECSHLDINHPDNVKTIITDINKLKVNLFGLVHCAGDMLETPLLMLKPEQIQQQLSIHLSSAIVLAQYASRLMSRNKLGSIVFISSIVAHQGSAGQSVYAAAKSGLFGLTKSLAKELGKLNIRVNSVSPGFIETGLTEHYNAEQKQQICQQTCMQRTGKAEDVAAAISFLLSDKASFITAQDLAVDGGLNLGC
ncbi:SDR family NAD(P)-dependent oxidoreductase [Catenovulum maritimum]|uniref:Ketoreductase domain-containing protein n=1 Tax=Catenovulum maritimum TaxID=1513271 RepID=A0A0J8H0R5_9ALTE|nr:SDR family oxidoreductase [Catenovulum maritimum]KMT66608.1 hypothetical protein XM47_03515 [Catenovulum maritimum]